MTRMAPGIVSIQTPLVVETGTARAAERHRCHEVELVNLSLKILKSDEQKSGVRSQAGFSNSCADRYRITIRVWVRGRQGEATCWQLSRKSEGRIFVKGPSQSQ